MIRVVATVDGRGRLRCLDVEGHAEIGGYRSDPACAGVSVLARTAARVVAQRRGFVVEGGHDGPGTLTFTVQRCPLGGGSWLRGVTATLLKGLEDLSEEFPTAVSVQLIRAKKREGQ